MTKIKPWNAQEIKTKTKGLSQHVTAEKDRKSMDYVGIQIWMLGAFMFGSNI